MEFKDLGLPEKILKAITKLGFVSPSEIQEKAIPVLSAGERDFVGLAQTGTGKTAAFGLPLIQHINFESKDTQGLVICPTRELCMQITKDLISFRILPGQTQYCSRIWRCQHFRSDPPDQQGCPDRGGHTRPPAGSDQP